MKKLIELRREVKGAGEVHDLAIFLDYMSLPQKGEKGDPLKPEQGEDRSAKDKEIFDRGLKNVNLWYAHQQTVVWLIKWTPPTMEYAYMSRGWPFFESQVAALIKDSRKLFDFGQCKLDRIKDWNDAYGQCQIMRRPPMTPDHFAEAIKSKHFTNGNTDSEFVVKKYRETFLHVIGHAKALRFIGMNWADDTAADVAYILSDCNALEHLLIGNNKITTKGAENLIKAAHGCPTLRSINLEGNPIAASDHPHLAAEWLKTGKEPHNLHLAPGITAAGFQSSIISQPRSSAARPLLEGDFVELAVREDQSLRQRMALQTSWGVIPGPTLESGR